MCESFMVLEYSYNLIMLIFNNDMIKMKNGYFSRESNSKLTFWGSEMTSPILKRSSIPMQSSFERTKSKILPLSLQAENFSEEQIAGTFYH